MVRWGPWAAVLLVLAGCGEERRPRAVPVATTPSAANPEAGQAVTRPPRAIATH